MENADHVNNTNSSKAGLVTSTVISVIELAAGYLIIGFFGLIFLIMGLVSFRMPIWLSAMCLIFMIIGILLLIFGYRRRGFHKIFRNYSARLSQDQTGSITRLANGTGKSYETVEKQLQKMIARGFFSNAYIDGNRKCVIFSHFQNQNGRETPKNAQHQGYGARDILVTCKGCGASNKIKAGTVTECEYCGAKIG